MNSEPIHLMSESEKQKILSDISSWFSDNIVKNHLKNTEKLCSLDKFTVNPFLVSYLAKYSFGSVTAENIAKSLIYPRVMGTSITTSFGTHVQNFISEALPGYASTTPGIDVEFISRVDGRKKWCQLKSGPNTINKDDVKSILDHFKTIRGLARVNRMRNFNADLDCVVGVLYGARDDLNSHYKKIDESNPVLVGQEFWFQLTGDEKFYIDIIEEFEKCAAGFDARESDLQGIVESLADDISKKYPEMIESSGE